MISFGEERKRGERKYHRAFVFETISRQNEKFDSYFTRLLRLLVCVYVRICCVCKLRRRFTETRRRFPSSSPSLSQLETAQSCGRSTGCKLKQRAERGGPRFNYRRVSRYIRDVETTMIRTRARLFRDDDEQQAEQRSRQTLCIAIRLNSPPVNEDFNLFSLPSLFSLFRITGFFILPRRKVVEDRRQFRPIFRPSSVETISRSSPRSIVPGSTSTLIGAFLDRHDTCNVSKCKASNELHSKGRLFAKRFHVSS